ncbi:MAG: PIN domain-containing protein [Spirosomataceae bacterium]
MKKLMFDSSVWIDVFRGRENPESLFLRSALVDGLNIFICPPIIQELLQGARDYSNLVYLQNRLASLIKTNNEPYEMAENAGVLFYNLRKKGITIRKPNDCLIAVYCIINNIELVHNDSDFDLIAQNSPLKIYKP